MFIFLMYLIEILIRILDMFYLPNDVEFVACKGFGSYGVHDMIIIPSQQDDGKILPQKI